MSIVMKGLELTIYFIFIINSLLSNSIKVNAAAEKEKGSYESSATDVKVIMSQPLVTPFPNIVATVVVLSIPPCDPGTPPHFHSGPTIGYVLEGEFLFQVNDEPHRIIPAGTAFHEKDRVTHIWGGNASNTTTCRIVATIYGRPGEDFITFVKDYPRENRKEALALVAKGF